MGALTREAVVVLLRRENPRARADDLALYADCFLDYQEAVANIREHGTVVVNPRTGSPLENPYVKIKTQAMGGLLKLRRIQKTDALWAIVAGQEPTVA